MKRDPGEPSRSMSLMLVDDNPTFLRILRQFLEEASVPNLSVVATAGNGKEALDIAPTLRPSLMVVDLLMPDIHGPELIRSLRHLLPETGIIALTMLGADVYRQAALAAGADDCIARADLEPDLLPALLRVAEIRSAAIGSRPLPGGLAASAPGGSEHCHRVNGGKTVPAARPVDAPLEDRPGPATSERGSVPGGGRGRAGEPCPPRRPPREIVPG
jgi:CheY-like chemotaxis protein